MFSRYLLCLSMAADFQLAAGIGVYVFAVLLVAGICSAVYRVYKITHAPMLVKPNIQRGPGRKPGAYTYTRKRLSHSRGAERNPGASFYLSLSLCLPI